MLAILKQWPTPTSLIKWLASQNYLFASDVFTTGASRLGAGKEPNVKGITTLHYFYGSL